MLAILDLVLHDRGFSQSVQMARPNSVFRRMSAHAKKQGGHFVTFMSRDDEDEANEVRMCKTFRATPVVEGRYGSREFLRKLL